VNPDGLGLGAAFLAGLAASGHCASMCGGIAGALAMRTQQAAGGSRLLMGLAYNLARVGSYAVAGAIVGILGHLVLHTLDIGLLAIGYIREFAGFRGATLGLGARGAVNLIPGTLKGVYGSHTPTGLAVFLRVRPALLEGAHAMDPEMHHGDMSGEVRHGDMSGHHMEQG